jgi:hypothetical protein
MECHSINVRDSANHLKEMREIAKSRRGKLLSTEYVTQNTKYVWQCEMGHVWKTEFRLIKHFGSWCPECDLIRRKDTENNLKKMRQVAERQGGKLISPKYDTANTEYMWECEKGHRFKASFTSIKKGKWCHDCEKLGLLEDMRQYAREKGGELLSTEYLTQASIYRWKCAKGHMWENNYKNTRTGSWCPDCMTRAEGRGAGAEVNRDAGIRRR